MNKLEVEVQYFNGCPHSKEFIENLRRALTESEFEYAYKETLVETSEKAKEINFRGSPTILINGADLEGAEAPDNPGLNCRVYRDGVPTVKEISARLRALARDPTEFNQKGVHFLVLSDVRQTT